MPTGKRVRAIITERQRLADRARAESALLDFTLDALHRANACFDRGDGNGGAAEVERILTRCRAFEDRHGPSSVLRAPIEAGAVAALSSTTTRDPSDLVELLARASRSASGPRCGEERTQ